ncbi:MAG: hypothetical protein HC804_03860 [Anaerolineae bacterium]|nr:hypothetical protein [Anaerolineae bacterium]
MFSADATGGAAQPVGVVDSQGQVHLLWQNGAGQMMHGRCQNSICAPAAPLPAGCGSGQATNATMTLDAEDRIMAVWQEGSGLAYAVWPANQSAAAGAASCVIAGGQPEQPQVTAVGDGRFQLIFADNGRLFSSAFDGSGWKPPVEVAKGHSPAIVSTSNGVYLAWCSPEGQVVVQTPAAVQELIAFPGCHGRISLAQDDEGSLHAVWYATEAIKVTDVEATEQSLIYESVRHNGAWSEPAIVSRTGTAVTPQLTAVSDGILHMVWADNTAVTYTSQTEYDCTNPNLNHVEQAVYDALNQPQFKPADEQLPVCDNRYEAIFYTPNPTEGSGQLPTENGAFDRVAAMAKSAQYEVLFAVMQWDAPTTEPSPGSTLAQAVVQLYNNLKEHPEQYPKGMRVRILTGQYARSPLCCRLMITPGMCWPICALPGCRN